jgi:hypothetical protein
MAEANWLAEFRSLVIRLERALGGGKPAFTANNPVERVARGLSFGLNSRALAVGALIEVPEAAAGASDCIRSMAEACGHLAWLLEGPGTLDQRARCLELGQAKVDAENRAKVLSTHQADWVPEEVRKNLEDQCQATRRVLEQAENAHGSGCEICRDQGRTYRSVQRWLEQRARDSTASHEDLNVYAAWVAASADAHQLSPTRWWNQEKGVHELELSDAKLKTFANTAVRCFLLGWSYVFALLRPEGQAELDAIKRELEAGGARLA